jgi:hypothetical protein
MKNTADQWDRRDFLRSAVLAGTAGLAGLRAEQAVAEPRPETTRIRLQRIPSVCVAPQYVAEEYGLKGSPTCSTTSPQWEESLGPGRSLQARRTSA